MGYFVAGSSAKEERNRPFVDFREVFEFDGVDSPLARLRLRRPRRVVELSGTKERPRVNLVWKRFPVEPTRSYEAMIEMMVKKDVDNALVTHQGRDLNQYFDPEGLDKEAFAGVILS